MKARRAAIHVAVFAVLIGAASGVARAEPRDPAAAEALFDEGRALMRDGQFARACPKLEASQRLDPGVGTLLNLGDCYESAGRYASAWARFREAASAALSAGQSERERIARGRAAALEPKLSRLVVRVAEDDPALAVAKDGVPIDREAWGSAVPLDPGEHALEATAPGKKSWHGTVSISAAPMTVTVDVPSLEASPPAAPAPLPPRATDPVGFPATPSPARDDSRGLGAQRGVAVGAAGVGVVALVLAGGLALSARSIYSDARGHCTSAGCDPDGVRLGHDAGVRADFATAGVIVGGVALAAATVLWLTSK